ncbi:MAG: flagellar basal body rod protein FlgB [Chitinivibrionales bacterium]|nr:flagellar basal body rod protein FlgB [Chitinivibrionales bacterium]
MINNAITEKTTIPVMLKSLDASMLRLRAITNNVANVTTPEFKRVEVGFEQYLRDALDSHRLIGTTTDENHLQLGKKRISAIQPIAYKPADPTLPSGVNNVDIDHEMAKLAESQLMYSMGLRFLKGAYAKLNAAVQAKSIPNI